MDYKEARALDVDAHLGLYEVTCLFSRASLRLDKEMDFSSLVWEIIPKLYLLEAHAHSHALETSGFAAKKNHSSFWRGGGVVGGTVMQFFFKI